MLLGAIGGAMVGAMVGFLVGNWAYGEKCVLGAIDYDCSPAEDLKVYLLTVIGLAVGLAVGFLTGRLASRLRRF